MTKRFENISLSDMTNYLNNQGFSIMDIQGTNEVVFGKVIKRGEHKLSMRIYTAIDPTGLSRPCGSDAIRIMLMFRYGEKVLSVGKAKRCLRTKNWQKNLGKAISSWSEDNWRICTACDFPMVEKKGKNGTFWGCVTFAETKCNGIPKSPSIATKKAVKSKLTLAKPALILEDKIPEIVSVVS